MHTKSTARAFFKKSYCAYTLDNKTVAKNHLIVALDIFLETQIENKVVKRKNFHKISA